MAKRKKARSASPMAGGENDRAMRVARLRAPTIIERDRVFYPLVIALGVIVPAIGAFLLFREGAPSLDDLDPKRSLGALLAVTSFGLAIIALDFRGSRTSIRNDLPVAGDESPRELEVLSGKIASRMRTSRLRTTLLAGAAIVSGFLVGVLGSGSELPTTEPLRAGLAARLGVPRHLLFLNLPPAAHRYPGALVWHRGSEILASKAGPDDPDFIRGPEFDVPWCPWEDRPESGIRLGALAGSLPSAARVELSVERCRKIELLGPDLRRRVETYEEENGRISEGQLVAVVRSYVGLLRLRVERPENLSEDGWEAVKKGARRAEASGRFRLRSEPGDARFVELAMNEPTLFAYEAEAATWLRNHLGPGRATNLRLRPIGPAELPTKGTGIATASVGTARWGLATIASGHYPAVPSFDQPWNADSARLAEAALAPYGPAWVKRRWASPTAPLGEDEIEQHLREAARKARDDGLDLLVVYTIGHAISRASGELLFMTADATTEPLEPTAVSPDSKTADSPLEGPLGDLIRSVNEVTTFASSQGFFSLKRACEALDGGVPYVFIVDSCFPNRDFATFRDYAVTRFGAPEVFLDGPNQSLTREFVDRIWRFAGRVPALMTDDPVILAARPGTLAEAVADPASPWGDLVGPLAARLWTETTGAEVPRLDDLVVRLIDYQVGPETHGEQNDPVELEAWGGGSVSWSRLETLRRIGSEIGPGAIARPAYAGDRAKVLREERFENAIRDFAASPDGTEFLVHTDWTVWHWRRGHAPRAVVIEQPFAQLAADGTGSLYAVFERELHRFDGESLEAVTGETDLFLKLLDGAPEGALVFLEDDGDVATAGGDVAQLRRADGARETIGRFESIDAYDTTWRPEGNDLVYSLTPSGRIVAGRGETWATLAEVEQPGMLASSPDYLYCLRADRKVLYRIAWSGDEVETCHVTDLIGEPAGGDEERGFQAIDGGHLLLSCNGRVWEIDPSRATWRPR